MDSKAVHCRPIICRDVPRGTDCFGEDASPGYWEGYILSSERSGYGVHPTDRRVERMVSGQDLRPFAGFSVCRQAELSPLFHPAAQYRNIRQASLLELLCCRGRSAVGFADHDHGPVFTNQTRKMRRQFNERHVHCLSNMPERPGEFVRTPHVENKQSVIPSSRVASVSGSIHDCAVGARRNQRDNSFKG